MAVVNRNSEPRWLVPRNFSDKFQNIVEDLGIKNLLPVLDPSTYLYNYKFDYKECFKIESNKKQRNEIQLGRNNIKKLMAESEN